MTRETWLQAAIAVLRVRFVRAGHPLPDTLHVSIGFPSRGGLRGKRGVTLGQCWAGQHSADGAPHIFVSPLHDDAVAILDTLAHELAHAAAPLDAKHGPKFVRVANAVGLTKGKPTSIAAGDELRAELARLNAELGPLPHAALDAKSMPKAGATRLVKVACASCGYVARVTRVWLDGPGAPLCPSDREQMDEV